MTPTFKLKNAVLLMALATVYPLQGHTAAGIAQFTAGDVNVRRGTAVVALAKGRDLESGDTVTTGPGARAQLRFTDGGLIALQPDSQFVITKYVDANDGAQDSFLVNFARGSMRAITGLIGKRNRENYKVQTTTATVGIRGSGFSASYNADGSLSVTAELDEIEVCTNSGCVRLTAGESCIVTSNDRPPVRDHARANLPTPAPRQDVTITGNKVTANGLSALITLPNKPVPQPVLKPVIQTVGAGWNAAFAGSNAIITQILGDNASGGDQFTLETAAAAAAAAATAQRQALSLQPGPITVPSPDPTTQLIKFSGVQNPSDIPQFVTVTGEKLTLTSYDSRGKVADADFLGWGHWATSNQVYGGVSSVVSDLHYVVGKPTSASDMAALSGRTGTYGLIGGTASYKADSAYGGASLLGSVIGGQLNVNFFSASASISGSLDAKFGSTVVNVDLGSVANGARIFSGNSGVVNGFFVGAGATRLGITFNKSTTQVSTVSGTPLNPGTVSGSAGFQQTNLSAIPAAAIRP